MSFSLAANPLFLLLCALAAAALTYWTYNRTNPRVQGLLKASLVSLRFVILFLVLFLLFQPILRLIDRTEREPVLAVILDDSQSLGIERARNGDLSETVRQAISNISFDEVGGQIKFYRFSGDVEPMEQRGATLVEDLTLSGPRTNISRALEHVRDDLSRENLRAVLLVSDGLYNAGRNPIYTAETYGVPIHTVVVGDTTQQRDVLIRRVLTNEIAYVDVELPIQVNVRAEGFPEQQATVTLYHEGQRIDASDVSFAGETAEATVELAFTPRVDGLQRLTVHVTEFPEEITHANNVEAVSVRVLDSKRRVLIISAPPNPDLVAIRRTLAGDQNMEVTVRTQQRGPEFYEGGFPESLAEYDALILAGYPAQGASRAHIQQIAGAAEGGKPLLFLLSRQTDLAALQRDLSDVLPAVPRSSQMRLAEAVPRSVPESVRHPIFEIPDVTPAQWLRLPPLAINETGWTAAPDARILASPSVRGIDLEEPLFVVSQRRNLRTAALLGAGVWRWQNLPEDLDYLAPFWPALLSNTLQWISAAEDDRLVRVRPVETLFAGGESVQFTGQVYDESLNPVDGARVSLVIIAPDGNEFPFTMESIGSGRYVLDAGNLPHGDYRFAARAARDELDIGSDAGSFSVGELNIEFKETRADAGLMRQIALRSGGTFHYTDEVAAVPRQVAGTAGFTPVPVELERERELRHVFLFLFVVIALLTVEWFLRKRNGLI